MTHCVGLTTGSSQLTTNGGLAPLPSHSQCSCSEENWLAVGNPSQYTAVLLHLATAKKHKALSVPYLEGLLHCVIQLERGLRSTVDAFRLQEVVKPLYWEHWLCINGSPLPAV